MLTPLDRRIAREIQERFPVVPRPYAAVAARLGITEKRLISRARDLKRRGIIRYLGIVFALDRIGFSSTLVAMRVPVARIGRVADIVNTYPHVTHNYIREGAFNLWFTISAPSRAALRRVLREIREKTGVRETLDLPADARFKIGAVFKI